jgi:hypothetical protein
MAQYLKVTGTPPIALAKNAAIEVPLEFDPGNRWQYGINMDWVGKAWRPSATSRWKFTSGRTSSHRSA